MKEKIRIQKIELKLLEDMWGESNDYKVRAALCNLYIIESEKLARMEKFVIANEMTTQCQFCGQIQNANGSWNGIHQDIFQDGTISHGACPMCFDIELEKIESMVIE
jgi:hypothetical protein